MVLTCCVMEAYLVCIFVRMFTTGMSDDYPGWQLHLDYMGFANTIFTIVLTPLLLSECFARCYSATCCCGRHRGRALFAPAAPLIVMIELTIIWSLSRSRRLIAPAIWEWEGTGDSDKDALAILNNPNVKFALDSYFGHLERTNMALFIIHWLLWGTMLGINLVTRFVWWPKEHPYGLRPLQQNQTCVDHFVDWPFIHWIALATWGFVVLALLFGTAFAWVGMQAIAVVGIREESVVNLGGWLGTNVAVGVVLRVLFGYYENEWLSRLIGGKLDTGCLAYKCFLYGPFLPVIGIVFVTIGYTRCASFIGNPAMGITREGFISSVQLASTYFNTPDRDVISGEIWDQNQSIRKATLAFLILGWIGITVLGGINHLSFFGIRPRSGAARVDGQTEPEPAANQAQGGPPQYQGGGPGVPPGASPAPGYNQPTGVVKA
jgi:hypothetical protein